jgi:uncharacterized delta-60 repeat protein
MLVVWAQPVSAAPGQVDLSFGTGGLAQADLGASFKPVELGSVAPEASGRFLATRTSLSNGPPATVRRFEPNGAVDPSFPPKPAPVRPTAVQQDGKELVVEEGCCGGRELTRLNVNGTPDLTFGQGGRSDQVPFPIQRIVPLPSGKILVAGHPSWSIGTSEQTFVARLQSDGKLDPGFGTGGAVELQAADGIGAQSLLGVAPRPNGGVVVVVASAFSPNSGGSRSTLVGLAADGALDPSYGNGGTVRPAGSVTAFQPLADGRLVVAGNIWGKRVGCCGAYESDLFAARYTDDGKPDPSFGSGSGSAEADFGGIDATASLLVGGDGSVLLGGSSVASTTLCTEFEVCSTTPVLARFTPGGAADLGFAAKGLLRLETLAGEGSPGAYGFAPAGIVSVSPRPSGGVIAAGGAGAAAFLVAVESNGGLDQAFGNGGVVTEREPMPGSASASATATAPDGRILVTAISTAGGFFGPGRETLVRYRRNGALDLGFGGGDGHLRVPGGVALTVDRHGRSLVLGRHSVARVTAAGRLDETFGEGGVADLGALRGLELQAIVTAPRGRILVAGLISSGKGIKEQMAVMRLRPDGSPDPSFSGDGIAVPRFGGKRSSGAGALATDARGRILVAGYVLGKGSKGGGAGAVALLRLRPNGSPDRGFGRSGHVVSPGGGKSRVTGLALRGGAPIVAALRSGKKNVAELLLRYRRDGRPDLGFGRRGVVRTATGPAGRSGFENEGLALLAAKRRIVTVRSGSVRPVRAYRLNGRPAPAYGSDPAIAAGREAETFLAATPIATLQNGRPVLAWTDRLTNPDGTSRTVIDLQRLTGG